MQPELREIADTFYCYRSAQEGRLKSIAERVVDLRESGSLNPTVLHHLRQYFKIKNIYHSNAIEGNILNIGETRQVVEMGLTITGKPLKDQVEAKNLASAVDFLEKLAVDYKKSISLFDIALESSNKALH